MENVLVVVLTGGPCAGKTSALAFLLEQLNQHPIYKLYDIFTVCESATLLGNSGPQYPGLDESRREELIYFEEILMKLQIQLEDSVINIAKFRNKKAIIICDRGALDLKPYIPAYAWEIILKNTGFTEEVLCARYHAVIHLVSVAIGAESFYSLESNAVRIETIEEARALDGITYDSWKPHSHLFKVDNSGNGFQEKLDQVLKIIIDLANSRFNE